MIHCSECGNISAPCPHWDFTVPKSELEVDHLKFKIRSETLQRECDRLCKFIDDQKEVIDNLNMVIATLRRRVESLEADR